MTKMKENGIVSGITSLIICLLLCTCLSLRWEFDSLGMEYLPLIYLVIFTLIFVGMLFSAFACASSWWWIFVAILELIAYGIVLSVYG